MKLSWTNFTESRKSASAENTVANSMGLPMRNVRTLIETKVIAAVTFCGQTSDVKSIFRPRFLPTSDGTPPSIVFGNAFNQHGFVCPMKVEMSQGRFCGILSGADMDIFGLDKPTAIPTNIAVENNLGEGEFYLITATKAIPGHFQQKFPTGKLTDVQDILETNGVGFAVWIALLNSADSQAKINTIRTIYEHETIQENLEAFVAYGGLDVDLSGPMLTAEFDMLECFPDQLEELKAVFSESAGSPRDSLVVHQELTTSKDRHESQNAAKGMLKLQLPFIGADIDGGKIVKDSVRRPILTVAMMDLQSTPPSGRKEQLSDILKCFVAEAAKSVDPTNVTENCTFSNIPLPILDNIIMGRWAQEQVSEVSADAQLNNFSIFTFQPQDPADSLVQSYMKEETSDRAQKKSDGAISKKLRDLLNAFGDMDPAFAFESMINARMVFSALVDFKTMKAEAKPSIFDTISIQLITWFMLQTTKQFPKWRASTNEKMDHLGALLVQWAELFFIACGNFANSLHNGAIIKDPDGDVSQLDFSPIENFLRDFKLFKEDICNKQRTVTPHTQPSVLYIAGKKNSKADEISRQPQASALGRDDRSSRDDHGSRQQQQSRGQDSGTSNGQGAPKRQRSSPSSGASPSNGASSLEQRTESNGILILHEGATMNQAFPQGFPACKEFVTRGFVCPRGNNCNGHHWNKLKEASGRHKTVWIKHLRDTKAGYFNQWKLGPGLNMNDQEFQGLAGTPNSPPPRE